MVAIFLIMYLILLLSLTAFNLASAENPDAERDFMQVCTAHGYLVESHNVTTADGYILTLYRIPGKQGESPKPGKPAVFLQHGLLDLSDTWIMNIPSPGFMFADAGFDVWFGNSRGSYHSLGNVNYNCWKDKAYWEFTWMQMAEYDIPASIDYALQVSGQSKLTYVGHSQGTLIMFAHLSEHPEFIEKLNIFIALAPVGSVRHIDVEILQLLEKVPFFNLLDDLGIHSFLPNPNTPTLFYYACDLLSLLCKDIAGVFADMEVSQDNTERFPVILAHEPGGTSVMNMKHWQQMINYNVYKVQKYDYGTETNQQVYGSPTPPLYNFTNIPGPIALYFGTEDRLADPIDGAWLRKTIPKESVVYMEDTLEFGHLTFLWGKDMSYFDGVINLARQHSQSSTYE